MQNKKKYVKGFDSNLKCRDFQYEIGKEYKLPEGEEVEMCNTGFHAIDEDECPLSVFDYYPSAINGELSRYCEVEIGGDTDKRNDKIVGSEIKIGAEIGIQGLVKAHVDWVNRHLIDDEEHKSANTGDCSSASNTGEYSSASNTGNCSSASNTGDCSSASNTGNRSSASNTGDCSSASNTGYCSSASNTGNCSSASNTGYGSSASVDGKDSVAIAIGYNSKAKGALGCAIVIVERGNWNGETYPLKNICSAIVDGVNIKADTWYTVKDGKFVETE